MIGDNMKKPGLHPLAYQTDAQPVVSTFPPIRIDTNPETFRRLIVLVPADTDTSAATRQIWKLADATGMSVQFLSLYKEAVEEPALRRRLITMASLLQDGGIFSRVNVEHGTNWLEAVKAYYQTNDVIVCFEEQHTGLLHRPLGQVLESNFKSTVYIISGLAPKKFKPNRLLQIGAWLGSITIILGFGLLQAKIVQLPEGGLQSVLLVLSIVPEFWLIWIWNSLFG
jgi:hypothetical protein